MRIVISWYYIMASIKPCFQLSSWNAFEVQVEQKSKKSSKSVESGSSAMGVYNWFLKEKN